MIWLAASADSDQTNSTTLTLSILDLGGLPALSVLGQTNITVSQAPGAGVQAVWPQSGTLVWVAAARQEWFWPVAGGMAQPLARPAALKTARHKTAVHKATLAAKAPVTTLPLLPWFYDGGGIQLYAFDVSTPARPVLSSTVTVGTNGWPNGNAASATNGLVYVSHSVWSNVGEGFNERNELDVVDFTVPPAPIARSPVNIPGALAGISRSGNVVYSVDFEGTLAALAYDGVSAYLIADLPAPTNSFQAALVEGETVYDARLSSSLLEAWTLANSGQFALEGSLTLPQPDYGMADFGNLLGLQVGSGLELVNITNPNQLVSVGSGASSQCLWLSLAGADGALGSGLWLPLGAYGVFSISAP